MKLYRYGTHRCKTPEETLAAVEPHYSRFGLTRLADITGLDYIQIPVYLGVRPLGATLSVSQGKGADHASAQVSAVMEAVEMWCAEYECPRPALRNTPASEMNLGYSIRDLQQHQGSLLTDQTPLDWLAARDLLSAEASYVPLQYVRIGASFAPTSWRPPGLRPSTNGLASGNTYYEALVHAMYELIERDISVQVAAKSCRQREYIDPATVRGGAAADLLQRISDAGVWVEIIHEPNPWEVPYFGCYVWSDDLPVLAAGAGVHSDPDVALSRAISEAVQSRLTIIAGTRDDIDPAVYTQSQGQAARPTVASDLSTMAEVYDRYTADFQSFAEEADWLARKLTARGRGVEPKVCVIADEEAFAVVKVVAPGLEFLGQHSLPRVSGADG
jgi:ribosomal protein S12 methylthiotransferase accessory factor